MKFVCTICGKGFARRLHLANHENTHTGERPYPCDVCGRRFTQKSHVRTHKMTHYRYTLDDP